MNVLLLSLPLGNLATPPLSLPSLTAYLRQHGIETHQRDLSIEIMDELLSPKAVQASFAEVATRVQALDRRAGLTPAETIRLAQLCELDMAAAYVTDQLEDALAYLREPSTCIDHRRAAEALSVVDWALLAARPATAPLRLSRHDLALGLGFVQQHGSARDPFWRAQPLVQRLKEHLQALVATHQPTVVGLSMLFRSQLPLTLLGAELIKHLSPSCHVVLGGPMVAHLGDTLIWDLEVFRYVDTLVVQEGEAALLALVRALEQGESPNGLPNTIRLRGEEVVCGPVRSGACQGSGQRRTALPRHIRYFT